MTFEEFRAKVHNSPENVSMTEFILNMLEPAEESVVSYPKLLAHYYMYCENESVIEMINLTYGKFWSMVDCIISTYKLPYEVAYSSNGRRFLMGCRCKYSIKSDAKIHLLDKYPDIFKEELF